MHIGCKLSGDVKAAILTAGSAHRLRPLTDARPKALLEVAGMPILRRNLASLLHSGVDEIVIGTGYRGDMIREAVASWFPELDVTFVDNPDYETTSNAVTLGLLGPHLDGEPFLLLDDDVVFDVRVLDLLLERGLDSVAVRSVGGVAAEEVKVVADDEDRILKIGVELPARGALGESIGIALFSADTSARLFEALARRQPHEIYEVALQEVIDAGATLFAVDIGTLYAIGVDTYSDLCAATGRVSESPELAPVDESVRLSV